MKTIAGFIGGIFIWYAVWYLNPFLELPFTFESGVLEIHSLLESIGYVISFFALPFIGATAVNE